MQELILKAKSLLESGEVARVLGWRKGENVWDVEPAFFNSAEELEELVYNGFCGANLSKYMIEASKLEGKTLVFLKPCDTYSFNQLTKEHRVDREKAYIIGVGCKGKLTMNKIDFPGVLDIEGAGYPEAAETLTVKTLTVTRRSPTRMPCWNAAMCARARSIRCMTSCWVSLQTPPTVTALPRLPPSRP
jgi:hypothetical protein